MKLDTYTTRRQPTTLNCIPVGQHGCLGGLANIQFATVRLVSLSVFFWFNDMHTDHTGGVINWTIYYIVAYDRDVFPRKDVPFGGFIDTPPY